MRVVRAFVLGAAAVGALAYVFSATVALALAASRGSIDVAIGPVVVLAVERVSGDTTTTLGSGLLLVAVLGGAINAAGAAWLGWRRSRRTIA